MRTVAAANTAHRIVHICVLFSGLFCPSFSIVTHNVRLDNVYGNNRAQSVLQDIRRFCTTTLVWVAYLAVQSFFLSAKDRNKRNRKMGEWCPGGHVVELRIDNARSVLHSFAYCIALHDGNHYSLEHDGCR